jgi:hypothetical protein
VKGLGFSVLRHNWNFSKTPLIIDFKKLKSLPARKRKGFVEYLPMNQYFNEFSSQLKDLKVLAIVPDTLILRFAFKKTQTVKVVPVLNYETGASIIPDSLIRVIPESVTAEGPDLILDTIKSFRTLPVKVGNQNVTFSRSIGLEDIHKLVKTDPAKVTVSIRKNNPF